VRREKRAKSRCKDLLKELAEKTLLTAELEDRLSVYQGLCAVSDNITKYCVLCCPNIGLCLHDHLCCICFSFYVDIPVDLFRKPTDGYTDDQKTFALTLHLYSPKAYEFLRSQLPLPSSRSIRRYSVVHKKYIIFAWSIIIIILITDTEC
jgi:hypothetical protein